jgi:hypothetical protein
MRQYSKPEFSELEASVLAVDPKFCCTRFEIRINLDI